MRQLLLFLLIFIPYTFPFSVPYNDQEPKKDSNIKGLTLVAPPKPFPDNPMMPIKNTGADWIAVVPYGFSRKGEADVHYNTSGWQWWGEKPEGAKRTIELAKQENLKVMLKPQLWIMGSWTGDLDFEKTSDWEKWEAGYEKYILEFAKIATDYEVEIFCIGTEFRESVKERESFWRNLINKVKALYKGKIVYAANWDDYDSVPFWDELDYIGINAYFPLEESTTPQVESLIENWQSWKKEIKSFSHKKNKKILFTEFGYLSVDRCAWKTWEIEKKVKTYSINEQAQANALDALYTSFWEEDYWAGGFLWKWFPNMRGHEGYPERDYTPQGKLAEEVLEKWFEK